MIIRTFSLTVLLAEIHPCVEQLNLGTIACMDCLLIGKLIIKNSKDGIPMIKMLLLPSLFLSLFLVNQLPSKATFVDTTQDSRELIYQDTIMLLLPIDESIKNYYSKILTTRPGVYPYDVKVTKVQRLGEFRSFRFLYTLEVEPAVGPHVYVGKDRLVFEIASTIPNLVKLNKFEHLRTYDLPPKWKHILRQ
jgi:hypothetical protein